MRVEFGEAAHRHYTDGLLLRDERRRPNADHLFGLAAECAFKALMVVLGARTSPTGDLSEKNHRKHINDGLWEEFQILAKERRGARYLTKCSAFDEDFAGWSIEQRYAANDQFQSAPMESRFKGVTKVMATLEKAELDGDAR